MTPLLSIEGLSVDFTVGERVVRAVRNVSLSIAPGEVLAIVGESGSGKSATAASILKLLPPAASLSGSVRLNGEDLLTAPDTRLRAIRGADIGMIFQEPMSSLNPLHTIGRQIAEVLMVHTRITRPEARRRAVALLEDVGIASASTRLDDYPHQLSGGQRQRVMIAMALANQPKLLIADEPTTALDVTVQAQILALLKTQQHRRHMAMLFITHDLGIVRHMADRVAVMTNGEIVETGPTSAVFADPAHAYTRHLMAAEPTGAPAAIDNAAPVVAQTEQLAVWFPIKRGLLRRTVGHIRAVDGVSLTLRRGQTLGVVGESGSGKSTLGRALLRLVPSNGRITLFGDEVKDQNGPRLRALRRRMQIVFQDPFGSLSPRMTIGDIVAEGLLVHSPTLTDAERKLRVGQSLREVGLDPASADRYPHEFSGGQRQRIAIARAIILEPELLVLDEPTSALDMSVQAQIVDLLRDLQKRHGLAYLFISHDLRVVRALATDIVVMKDGKVVESGPAHNVLESPRTDYTRTLLAAAQLDLAASSVQPSPKPDTRSEETPQ